MLRAKFSMCAKFPLKRKIVVKRILGIRVRCNEPRPTGNQKLSLSMMDNFIRTAAVVLWIVAHGSAYRIGWNGRVTGLLSSYLHVVRRPLSSAPSFTIPPEGTVGSFVDETRKDRSFLECNLIGLGQVNGKEYGVGFPVDTPVMLTYFEGNNLRPVRADHPDYSHLFEHISVQLDGDDLQLLNTPIVLTLHGELEMDDGVTQSEEAAAEPVLGSGVGDADGAEEEEGDEVTIEELLADRDFLNEADEEDEDLAFDESERDFVDAHRHNSADAAEHSSDSMAAFMNEPIHGGHKLGSEHAKPDFEVRRSDKVDLSDVPADAFVTPEDTLSLQRAHRKADRIIRYAADMKLIGSFHHKKHNYHLVRLLEPIFVMGRRNADVKGHVFSLLDDHETEQVRPTLEAMMVAASKQPRSPQSGTHSGVDEVEVPGSHHDRHRAQHRAVLERQHTEVGSDPGESADHHGGRGFGTKTETNNRRRKGSGGSRQPPERETSWRQTSGAASSVASIADRLAGGAGITAASGHGTGNKGSARWSRRASGASGAQFQSAQRKWQQQRKP